MRIHHVALAGGLILATASPAISGKDSSWTLRVHGAMVDSTGGETRVTDGVSTSVNVGGGFGIGAEYRLSPRVGLDFSTLFAGVEIATGVSRGTAAFDMTLSMMPLTFAVPFHVYTGDRVDLFLAPTFSIVRFTGIETVAGRGGVGTSIGTDSDAALGAALGLDVPFGKGKWALSTGVRYMKTRANDSDIDPVIVTLGFAYRF